MLRMQGIVREIAMDIVCANGQRLPVLVNSVLVTDAEGEPRQVRTTVFDATERKAYERELLTARDRERVARERTEALQRITSRLAAAPDAGAVAAALVDELVAGFGAERGSVDFDADGAGTPSEFDEGLGAERNARVELALGGAGRLALEFAAPRRFDAQERDFLDACAGQATLALERAQLFEETRNVAQALQQSLLAGAPPHDERFDVAALYEPAIEQLEVGGDWHDAFRLSNGRAGIVVGDVVGRGLAAATAMGQLRSALRALAAADLEPAAVLGHLDTFVEQVEAARYATVVYAEVDPDSGLVTIASAGHLPPITIEPDGTPRLYMEGRGAPLGVAVPGVERTQAQFRLAPGGSFLLYTDGLVERRTEAIDAGLDRALDAVRDSAGAEPAQLVERLPARLIEGGTTDDDVCLLCFRLRAR